MKFVIRALPTTLLFAAILTLAVNHETSWSADVRPDAGTTQAAQITNPRVKAPRLTANESGAPQVNTDRSLETRVTENNPATLSGKF